MGDLIPRRSAPVTMRSVEQQTVDLSGDEGLV
jgi:hypothetical protein